jgi:hypothetical protein
MSHVFEIFLFIRGVDKTKEAVSLATKMDIIKRIERGQQSKDINLFY